jgi:dephospho-CoA kinase
MTFKLGLTGSIGMGKSTTAQMFADEGCAVWDADAAVHRLYSKGGAGVAPLGKLFPDAIVDGAVSRPKLKDILTKTPAALAQIEQVIHPLVGEDRAQFVASVTSDIIVFDIPILFETGGDKNMDAVACVTVDKATQKARVLARGTMTQDQFEQILSKQMPNADKCAQSDYVIETETLEQAAAQVQSIVVDIRKKIANA